MKRLRPLHGDHAARHDEIAACKRGETRRVLAALRRRLHDAFQVYQTNYTNDTLQAQASMAVEADEAACCSHCYDVQSAKRDALIVAIRENQERDLAGTCQYCCIGKPNTMDHYLPKAIFPEFSVYALNLVPCCAECNGAKGDFWLENGERAIINFYRDTPPEEVFLSARLIYENGADVPEVEFSADWLAVQNHALRARVKGHFERLDLLTRYREAAVQKLNDHIITLECHARNASRGDQRHNLQAEAERLRRQYGSNYWPAALCNAMADSTEFLDSIGRPEMALP